MPLRHASRARRSQGRCKKMALTSLAGNAVFLTLQAVYYQKDRSGIDLPLSWADSETINLLNTFVNNTPKDGKLSREIGQRYNCHI
jgi:hypothetical protein